MRFTLDRKRAGEERAMVDSYLEDSEEEYEVEVEEEYEVMRRASNPDKYRREGRERDGRDGYDGGRGRHYHRRGRH